MAYQSALQALARQKAMKAVPATAKPRADSIDDSSTILQTVAAYPQYWRPQQSIDLSKADQVDAYLTGAYGKTYIDNITQKSLALNAPNYDKIFKALPTIKIPKKNPNDINEEQKYKIDQSKLDTIDKWVVYALSTGKLGVGQLKQAITTTEQGLNLAMGLTSNQISQLVDDYSNELNSANEKTFKAKVDFVTGDKYYKQNLPHPNFKYGSSNNVAKGIIKHPDITTGEDIMGPRFPGVPASGYMGPSYQAAQLNDIAELEAKKLTPYVDEVRFRASIKSGKPSTDFLPKDFTTPTTITPNQITDQNKAEALLRNAGTTITPIRNPQILRGRGSRSSSGK